MFIKEEDLATYTSRIEPWLYNNICKVHKKYFEIILSVIPLLFYLVIINII